MTKYFAGITNIEDLRKRYRELLKQFHPDNENGSTEITQQINQEYDRAFAELSLNKNTDSQTYTQEENEEFKTVMSQISHINADIEVIGSWLWVHGGYEYKDLLKSVGFQYAPRKRCWTWHFGEYRRYHRKEITLDEIRQKYGTQQVKNRTEQRRVGAII